MKLVYSVHSLPLLFGLSNGRGLQDSTTLDEACNAFANEIQHPSGNAGKFSCKCDGDLTNFTASCDYSDLECVTFPQKTTRAYTVGYTFSQRIVEKNPSDDFEECLYYRSTCNQVCFGFTQADGLYATVDGQKCASMTSCNENSKLDFVLDCSNLIDGAVLNTCTGEGIEGSPFQPFVPEYYDVSVYRTGSCFTSNALPAGLDPSHCEKFYDLDSVCKAYSASLQRPGHEDGQYVCECTGDSSINFEATCHYQKAECVMSPQSDSQFTISYTFNIPFRNSVETEDLQECLYFEDTCNTVCVGYTDSDGFFATVDGERCDYIEACEGGTHELDFSLNCTNLVPDSVVNTCTGVGVKGSPFEPFTPKFSDLSIYSPGKCDNAVMPRGLKTCTAKEGQQPTVGGSNAAVGADAGASGSTGSVDAISSKPDVKASAASTHVSVGGGALVATVLAFFFLL